MDNIILLDEENNEVEFEILDTFGVDEANYAALKQVEDELILIVEVIEKNNEIELRSIEDQDLLDELIEIYEEMKEDVDEY
ncbi:Protein of uncharacterised function (DUF1292) [Anaerococcus prevotii]|jgi:uncharacterized protein YrzB (UPF0473 family)|uniref:DUF1292 domain-containing protein n=1 Tax=Anaerococcus prevotii (strain ATCC 9321 / DSM 20548 / JCM 6508 / NCTC 11806 / PC1) TaxID=525919 RepID=C7RHK6_ANAPD|nr:DUF1292 domain-containing protein [Anaerococcus prevotii]ACV28967.1 hypothetical protein Apre_0939 [Anaerococcus prevotii DSM 20548]SUU94640.1 Protein of uncharacterised function (DUF1292) [Anaerococcus prevotii]